MTEVAHGTYNINDAEKQQLEELQKAKESEILNLNEKIQETEREWAQMVIKIKKERLTALMALSRSKVMLAQMDLNLAESTLHNLYENCSKRIKLASNEDKSKRTSTPRKQNTSRRRTTSYCGRNNALSLPNTVKNKDYETTDSGRDQSSSTSSQNGNSSQNKNGNPAFQYSISVTQLDMLKSNSSINSDNRYLTDSIIAEFNKPYLNLNNNRFEKDQANNKYYSNIHNWSMFTPNSNTEKREQVKIKPVSNIEAYKKSYTLDNLTYNSRLLYAPDSANIKPALHPRDPRNNSKLLSKSFVKSTSHTPMRLAIPRLIEKGNIDQKYEANTPQSSYVPPKKVVHRNIPIPVPQKPDYKSIYTPWHEQRYTPFSANRQENKHIITPLNRPENQHIPIIGQCYKLENQNKPITATSNTPKSEQTPIVGVLNKPENLNIPIVDPLNKPENRDIPIVEPDNNRYKPNNGAQKLDNKVLDILTFPLYSSTPKPYVFSETSKDSMELCIKNEENYDKM